MPSLFSTEFVYASSQECNLYSIDKGTTTRNIHITDTNYIQTYPVSLQPSSNPLVYYLSHPDGIRLCDFRKKKSNVLAPAERCIFLERIDEDWNSIIACFEDEINVIDIRNPKSLLLRWRYSGQIRKIECRRCPFEYNIHLSILLCVCICVLNWIHFYSLAFSRKIKCKSSETRFIEVFSIWKVSRFFL